MISGKSLSQGYLTGQLLIAMPSMRDPRFARSVVYLCAHNEQGAMGLVVNRLVGSISFPDLLDQLDIDAGPGSDGIPVHFGGPVETGRGFVLHSGDYSREGTLQVDSEIALTATIDILKDMAGGSGPDKTIMALGYAGWGAGQLDSEIQSNSWLHVDSDDDLLFDAELDNKWDRALSKVGIDPAMLSSEAGRA